MQCEVYRAAKRLSHPNSPPQQQSMNPSPPPSTAAAADVNQSASSSQSLPHQPPPPSLPSTTTPLKKPSSAQSTTVRPATDHHWYNKQVAAAPFPQPQSASLNPPNPNSNPNSSNLQLQFPNHQGTTQGLVYPVGTSSGGGSAFAMKNSNTNNSNASRSANGGDRSAAYSLQQLGRPDTLSNQQMQFLQSGYLNPSHPALSGGGSSALHGFPVTSYPKVGFSVATDRNGNREARSKDDSLAVVLNRRVRVSEGSSLYSLCRSWLKNGIHDQYQPTHPTRYSYLPRPLPTPAQTPSAKSSDTNDVEEEDKEDEISVELLSSEDLLLRHIKRAKRVRSRLREERLHRITRYKTRLAALLPTPVEPIRDETPADN